MGFQSSGMTLNHWVSAPDILKECVQWNIRNNLSNSAVWCPRRLQPLITPLWKPQKPATNSLVS